MLVGVQRNETGEGTAHTHTSKRKAVAAGRAEIKISRFVEKDADMATAASSRLVEQQAHAD